MVLREKSRLVCCPAFDEFREQNRIETPVTGLRSGFSDDGTDSHPATSARENSRLMTRFEKSALFIDMSPFAVDFNAQVATPKFRRRKNNPRGSD